MNNKVTGLIVASAVCALFSMNAGADDAAKGKTPEAKKSDSIMCSGKNGCAGKGGCKSEANSCKGKNSCSNHDFQAKNAAACKKAGGEVKKEEKKETTEKKS